MLEKNIHHHSDEIFEFDVLKTMKMNLNSNFADPIIQQMMIPIYSKITLNLIALANTHE